MLVIDLGEKMNPDDQNISLALRGEKPNVMF